MIMPSGPVHTTRLMLNVAMALVHPMQGRLSAATRLVSNELDCFNLATYSVDLHSSLSEILLRLL